ncbi:MAG: hypothetical protein ACWA47_04800 [Brevirhabdus sp.]
MTFALVLYFPLAIATLLALAVMILKVGQSIATCPDAAPTVHPASLTIVTGFVSMGLGGVALIGAMMVALKLPPVLALFAASGLACLTLGVGFSHAIATLRAVTAPVPDTQRKGPWEPPAKADQ